MNGRIGCVSESDEGLGRGGIPGTRPSTTHAYGAQLVDANGNITVKSDATKYVLELHKRLAKTMPESVYAYDNASNNKELISGKAALIMNAPSA